MEQVLAHIFSTEGLISLVTLTLLEVVLGIDNIVFISILSGKLKEELRAKATNIGLMVAIIPRVLLLFALSWMIGLTEPLFDIPLKILNAHFHPSGKDMILLMGGLFLIYKSTSEIHQKLEGAQEEVGKAKASSFGMVIFQISLLNIVFSFDSILTAVGLVDAAKPENLWIMILAVVFSMLIMILFANSVNDFVTKRPTVKMLALAFLLMIGTLLVMEGFHQEIEKGYVYFAMIFALIVELLNLRMTKRGTVVKLNSRYIVAQEEAAAHSEYNGKRDFQKQPEETSKAKNKS